MEYIYDVAISFAEEDRNAALALALAFELKGVNDVYYYPDKLTATVGKSLVNELKAIYTKKARYSVILLSKKYFKKPTAQEELKAIYKRVQRDPEINCVIPVNLKAHVDLSKYPALKRLAYLDWNFEPKKVVDILLSLLGKHRIEPGDILAKNNDSKNKFIQKNTAVKAKRQQNNMSINL